MPAYELALVFRQMTKPELVSSLKRSAEAILDKGGIIRKLENLGSRDLPHKMSEHGVVHRSGSYFVIQFDSQPETIADLKEEYGRDVDIVRRNVFKLDKDPETVECTLHKELKPPAYRPEVIQMMKTAKKREKPKYDHRSGIDYYPFQR